MGNAGTREKDAHLVYLHRFVSIIGRIAKLEFLFKHGS